MSNIVNKITEQLGMIKEGFDVKKVIQDLMKTDFKGNNEEQMKGIQLLKGLATNDDKLANAFMAKLSDAYTSIGKAVIGSVDEADDNDDDEDDEKEKNGKKKKEEDDEEEVEEAPAYTYGKKKKKKK